MSGSRLIEVGATGPDFTLDASDGATYSLWDVLRDTHVVLFFYPGNNTPG